ncbi:protein enabled homolog [Sycon ciliatum]|uniref:protein enabled homolog n=1 Tax=Sycon ciliatum TaxID=27933 RepID=UPI0031F6CA73
MTNTFLWCICCFVASLSQQFLAVFVAFPGSVVPAAVMALQRQGARREGGMAGQRTVRTGTLQGPPGAMSCVQIRIAEKYTAPSPVSLPLHFSAFVQSPLENAPVYTFGLESDVLRRAENRRRAEEAERRSQEQRAQAEAASRPVPMSTIMPSGILEPERPGTSRTLSQENDRRNNPASWSLRDFETQATDPFEMAELKTIDVMAELSTVFPSQAPAPGTTAQQGTPSPAAGAAATSGGSSPVNGVATLGTATASSATADARQQPQAVPRATARPAGGVAMPGLRAPSPNNALTTTAVTTMTDAGAPAAAAVASSGAAGQATLSACSSGAPVPSPRPRPRPRASPGAIPSSGPPPPASNSPETRQMMLPMPQTATTTAAVHPPTGNVAATTTSPAMLSSSTGPTPANRSPQARPRVPSPAAAVATGNPQGPPPAYTATVSGGTAAPSVTAMSAGTGDAFPPPYPMQPPAMQPPPPNEPRLPARVAPPPPYMAATNGDSACGGVTASGYVHSDYALPDVYSQLKRQEKKLVDQLKQMGFPQDRLSRAVQRLGNDQAKVLEFMFQINKFGESPHNFPPDSTETALVNNECSEEKALAALKLVFELREMGFAEATIHKALKEASNKRDAAIDYLISHA